MEIGKRKFVGNVIRSILLEIKLNWGCLRRYPVSRSDTSVLYVLSVGNAAITEGASGWSR